MLNPDSIMFRAPNEKYREEYERIFSKPESQCDQCKTLDIPICGQHGPLGGTVCDERKAMMK